MQLRNIHVNAACIIEVHKADEAEIRSRIDLDKELAGCVERFVVSQCFFQPSSGSARCGVREPSCLWRILTIHF